MPPAEGPAGMDADADAPRTPIPSHTRRLSQSQLGRSVGGFRHSQNQNRSTQQSYNIITGRSATNSPAPSSLNRVSSLESLKENVAPPDAEAYETQRRRIEELRAEVGTLTYRSETARQEKEMAEARQATELEDQRRRADDEYERAKTADGERTRAERAAELAKEEVLLMRERLEEETARLDKRAREAQEEARVLKEQLDELACVKDEVERLAERERMDARMKLEAAQLAVRELQGERESREELVGTLQAESTEKDARIGELEADNIRLKAQAGDVETMAIIRRELSDQVAHIRTLEARDKDQVAELKVLRQKARLTDVAEEEKRTLQRQVAGLARVQAELTEARIQRQRLEDERLSWAAYLGDAGEELEGLTGPDEVVRKLVEERLGRAHEVERVGALRADMAALQSRAGGLEQEKAALQRELEAARQERTNGTAASDKSKVLLRLERQRALAVKEVEYLRLQLNSFDIEDAAFTPETHDSARAQRIAELEGLVDQYKAEVHRLHLDLVAAESAASTSDPSSIEQVLIGNKRPRTDDPSDTSLSSSSPGKLRALEDEVSTLRADLALAQKDLSSSLAQLATLKERSKTRVLALKSNPTSDHEALKLSTITTLRRENADLLTTLRSKSSSSSSSSMIPSSVLDATLLELQASHAKTASVEKTTRRLKEVWSAKSHEFREAIASTLGWSVSFMPNGKMRVESMYNPSSTDEHENSIVFDGERGTMKVGGGPRSKFAARIGEQIGFWVRERGCVPGLLAALTIEFYEERMNAEAAAQG